MKEIKTEIVINSPVEKVWRILTDFNNYPNWNPFLKSITGDITVGKKIAVRIAPPGVRGMTIRPKIIAFDKNKEFSWRGHLLFSGIFDGEHKFELFDNKNGTTNFIHSEKFNGILIPLFKKLLDVNTTKGFEIMNLELKKLAEKK